MNMTVPSTGNLLTGACLRPKLFSFCASSQPSLTTPCKSRVRTGDGHCSRRPSGAAYPRRGCFWILRPTCSPLQGFLTSSVWQRKTRASGIKSNPSYGRRSRRGCVFRPITTRARRWRVSIPRIASLQPPVGRYRFRCGRIFNLHHPRDRCIRAHRCESFKGTPAGCDTSRGHSFAAHFVISEFWGRSSSMLSFCVSVYDSTKSIWSNNMWPLRWSIHKFAIVSGVFISRPGWRKFTRRWPLTCCGKSRRATPRRPQVGAAGRSGSNWTVAPSQHTPPPPPPPPAHGTHHLPATPPLLTTANLSPHQLQAFPLVNRQPPHTISPNPVPPSEHSNMDRPGMLVVPLLGQNWRFWLARLGSKPNANIFTWRLTA